MPRVNDSCGVSRGPCVPRPYRPRLLLFLFALPAMLVGGCGGGSSSGSSMASETGAAVGPSLTQITVDTLAPVKTPQGEPIAGARIAIMTLDRSLLASTTTSDGALDSSLSATEALSQTGLVDVSFSAQVGDGLPCLVSAEGGDFLSVEGGMIAAIANDTAPLALLPCQALDSGGAMGLDPATIELGAWSTAVLHTIELYTELEVIAPRLIPLLDRAAAAISESGSRDLDGDGTVSYLELLASHGHVDDHPDEFLESLRRELVQDLGSPVATQPNIVLIVADDLGYGDVSSFWQPGGISTPSIDRIARSGVSLTNFHVYPVCASTRSSLLSGRFVLDMALPGTGGPAVAGIPRSAQILPEYMRLLGYSTSAVGKWHLSSRPGFRPHERGFQEWMGFYGAVSFYDINFIREVVGATYFDGDTPFLPGTAHATDAFADRAIDYISRDHAAPFFLYVAFNAPHQPLWDEDSGVFSAPKDWLEATRAEYLFLNNARLDYVALVRHMDARIGDILNALEQAGVANDTLVIFTSDNGADTSIATTPDRPLGSNAIYRGGKASTYEGGIRVPLVAQWPGAIPAGHTVDEFTTLVDLWPTLREAVGFALRDDESRAPRRGTSLIPLLTATETSLNSDLDRTAYFGFTFRSSAVVRYPWKLVRERGDFLFNLAEDPVESTPLNDTEPERFEELLNALLEYQQR